jgi:transcriptional regulator with XRE-family HTH domain
MSATSVRVLDAAALGAAVETIARHRRISMREVSRETGLSPSTLTRLSQGQKPDVDALITLLVWLGEDVIVPFARLRNGDRP